MIDYVDFCFDIVVRIDKRREKNMFIILIIKLDLKC